MKTYSVLVGILAASNPNNRLFTGNVYLFKHIQLQLLKRNGFSYVLTPQDVKEHYIDGVYYDHKKNRWFKKSFPFPNVIYNRYPYRENEQEVQALLNTLEIPYFNRSFFNKWTVYQQLSKNKTLRPFLPTSSFVESDQDIFTFLNRFHNAYLKPVSSCQGEGIIKITQSSSQTFHLYSNHKTMKNVLKEELWNQMQRFMIHTSYFIQEEIPLDNVNGMKYDLRILVHRVQKTYKPTGIGVRAIDKKHITTHVPNGGQTLPFQLVKPRIQCDHINLICNEIGQTLTKSYGTIGEFSLDIGVSQHGHLYLFEVNSKPMKFDEKEIFQKGILQLTNLFYDLAHNEKELIIKY